jgi:hypothetical protein
MLLLFETHSRRLLSRGFSPFLLIFTYSSSVFMIDVNYFSRPTTIIFPGLNFSMSQPNLLLLAC